MGRRCGVSSPEGLPEGSPIPDGQDDPDQFATLPRRRSHAPVVERPTRRRARPVSRRSHRWRGAPRAGRRPPTPTADRAARPGTADPAPTPRTRVGDGDRLVGPAAATPPEDDRSHRRSADGSAVVVEGRAGGVANVDASTTVPSGPPGQRPAPDPARAGPGRAGGSSRNGSCTAAQLRRFIKSRSYVPLHELRRRFGLDGSEDDVSPMDVAERQLFVGLPSREAGLLAELLGSGDIGYELLLDPTCPIVVGVFAMRPVPRP